LSILADGTFVQFLVAKGAIAANAACTFATATAWQNNFGVIATAAINTLVIAVNDRALAALVSGNCTWFTERGLAFATTAATVAAGKIVAASSVAGTLYGATAGTDLQGNMANTVLVGASAATSPVYIM
jgi:hypothetical protein